MTNQEAIKVLLNERKCIDRNDGTQCDRKCESCDLVMDAEPIREAYNMAISALQALDEIYVFIIKSEASETTDGILKIFDAFEAQDAPDTNVDTISRRAAIDDLHTKDPSMIWDTADVEVWVNALPPARTEIIQCKDCKNIWYSGMAIIKGVPTKIYKCDWWDNRVVLEEGFCYRAERREG